MNLAPTYCKKHPSYKGIREPRCSCRACWHVYRNKQDEGLTKICNKCGNELPLNQFPFKNGPKTRRKGFCVRCKSEQHLQWKTKHREETGTLFAFVRRYDPERANRLEAFHAKAMAGVSL